MKTKLQRQLVIYETHDRVSQIEILLNCWKFSITTLIELSESMKHFPRDLTLFRLKV